MVGSILGGHGIAPGFLSWRHHWAFPQRGKRHLLSLCFFQGRAYRGKRRGEAFYLMDTSLTPMNFLWSCCGFLMTVVWSSSG
ncbi:unnamed protein product, partial [Prunus brigantina]